MRRQGAGNGQHSGQGSGQRAAQRRAPEKATSPENFLTGRDSPVRAAWSHCRTGAGMLRGLEFPSPCDPREVQSPVDQPARASTGGGTACRQGQRDHPHALPARPARLPNAAAGWRTLGGARPGPPAGSHAGGRRAGADFRARSNATPPPRPGGVPIYLQGSLVLGLPAAALLSQDLDVGRDDVTQADDHHVSGHQLRGFNGLHRPVSQHLGLGGQGCKGGRGAGVRRASVGREATQREPRRAAQEGSSRGQHTAPCGAGSFLLSRRARCTRSRGVLHPQGHPPTHLTTQPPPPKPSPLPQATHPRSAP